ncbi:MAG: 50S ribosomal protein L11 methyltransferase [Planctomycetales bacterium]|nr:50S ribosomal protein L11 methyltransferase [Planctomycetales bacterium]
MPLVDQPATTVTSHIALPNVPGGWTTREIVLAGRTFQLDLPASPDAFLDDPDVLAAHERDGYMPYWGYLWPTSLDLARYMLEQKWPAGLECLEIGAGIGLSGLAALAAGLHVTFSDYAPQAVDLALHNAQRNGFSDAVGCVLDWRQPTNRTYPLILGCDLIYEQPNHVPILDLLEKMLAKDGSCWLADPGRHQADAFVAELRRRPFRFECRPIPREPFPTRPDGVTNIWVIEWS